MKLDRDAGSDITFTFPTPLLRYVWPSSAPVNAALARLLLRLEEREPEHRAAGLRYSNCGGWRSPPDLLDRGYPEVEPLATWIGQACDTMMQLTLDREGQRPIGEYEVAAWANINRRGAYHVVHQHAHNHWSGVYYVNAGRSDPGVPLSGVIEFLDPRPAAAMSPTPGFEFGHKQAIEPEDGMMLLFPSWHAHAVHPYVGDEPRITVAFNVRVTHFELVAER